MNFTIDRSVLLDNLNNVSYAISSKVQIPGLSGIYFFVRKDQITLTTNNTDISIRATIKDNFNCIEEGDFIVSGKILIELIKKFTSKDVDFMTFDDKTIKLFAGKSEYKLTLIDLDSFVEVPFIKNNTKINIDSLNLKSLIRKTSFAISTSETRPILTGISLSTKGNTLKVEATDGLRVARKKIIYDFSFPELNVIIPGKSFDALNKIIAESEDNVTLYFSSTSILFEYKNILFQSRLIDGVFPSLDSIFVSNYLSQVAFNKEHLISIIDRISLFSMNEASNLIKFNLNEEGIVEFGSSETQLGTAKEEETPISISNKGNYSFAFSAKYFLEALHTFDDEIISINYNGEGKAFTITSEKDVNLIQLILPVLA